MGVLERSFFTKKQYKYDTGKFIERPNRFIAFVQHENKQLRCHVPDPGRLKELLIKNRTVLLRFSPDQKNMKTDASLVGVFNEDIWISLDSQLANRFILNTWKSLPILQNFSDMKSEFTYGKSRLDFIFDCQCLVEVKTATLVRDGVALFPDAPTERGTRHVHEIYEATKNGYNGLIIFIVPRSDATVLKPNKQLDEKFYNAVKEAFEGKVEFLILKCDFNLQGLQFMQEIPFALD